MKRMIIFMASIAIILLLSAFTLEQTFPRLYHHLITSSTDLGKENVDGLSLIDDMIEGFHHKYFNRQSYNWMWVSK